jgi:DNA-binding Lrp family transcriptional regulator
LLYRQRAQFSKQTGLPYTISLTEVGQYDFLLDQISRHRSHLAQSQSDHDPEVTFAAAALDWHAHIYRPLIAIIRKTDLLQYFPKRTLGDLYAYISFHQWGEGRKRKFGIGIDRLIPNTMEAFREKMTTQCKDDYPEMLRQITAFVMINVRGKHEKRILEKLFALKEVQEVHSIHGSVDVLAKIILTRDLLSSDAEIISEFVNDYLRPMSGIVSTQTLIPGHSLIKPHTDG